jgi:Fe-S-cluster containining protein
MDEPTTSRPWYHDGLAFRCTQCGNCCTGTPGYVWVDESEIAAIANYLDKPIGEIRLMHTRPVRGLVSLSEFGNGDCTFFDPQTRRCRIYPARPRQCRTWPFWRSNIATPEDWERTRKTCPGAGCGDLVTLEQIEYRASLIEL